MLTTWDEAAGLKVAAHCDSDQDARNAIAGGVASIEHGPGMTEETLLLMKKAGVVLVGTDFPEGVAKEQGYQPTLAPRFYERLQRAYKVGAPRRRREAARLDSRGDGGGHHRHARRPARGHLRAQAGQLRDEGRQGLQALQVRLEGREGTAW